MGHTAASCDQKFSSKQGSWWKNAFASHYLVENGDLDVHYVSSREMDATHKTMDARCTPAGSVGGLGAQVVSSVEIGRIIGSTNKDNIQGVRTKVCPKVGSCDAQTEDVGIGNSNLRQAPKVKTTMEPQEFGS